MIPLCTVKCSCPTPEGLLAQLQAGYRRMVLRLLAETSWGLFVLGVPLLPDEPMSAGPYPRPPLLMAPTLFLSSQDEGLLS